MNVVEFKIACFNSSVFGGTLSSGFTGTFMSGLCMGFAYPSDLYAALYEGDHPGLLQAPSVQEYP
jgi:hypothetical protein